MGSRAQQNIVAGHLLYNLDKASTLGSRQVANVACRLTCRIRCRVVSVSPLTAILTTTARQSHALRSFDPHLTPCLARFFCAATASAAAWSRWKPRWLCGWVRPEGRDLRQMPIGFGRLGDGLRLNRLGRRAHVGRYPHRPGHTRDRPLSSGSRKHRSTDGFSNGSDAAHSPPVFPDASRTPVQPSSFRPHKPTTSSPTLGRRQLGERLAQLRPCHGFARPMRRATPWPVRRGRFRATASRPDSSPIPCAAPSFPRRSRPRRAPSATIVGPSRSRRFRRVRRPTC